MTINRFAAGMAGENADEAAVHRIDLQPGRRLRQARSYYTVVVLKPDHRCKRLVSRPGYNPNLSRGEPFTFHDINRIFIINRRAG